MRNKYVFVASMLTAILLLSIGATTLYVKSEEPETNKDEFVIVTSFYPMYIATMNLVDGIDGVSLANLSEPQTGCLHDFQLTTADMKLLSTADVFIVNGGGIEGFLTEVASAYPDLVIVESAHEIELLCGEEHEHEHEHEEAEEEEHGHSHAENAHVWMSVTAYQSQIEVIAENLATVDTIHSNEYHENAHAYIEKLDALKQRQDALLEHTKEVPVLLLHTAFAYTAQDLGLHVEHVLDLDEVDSLSAGDKAELYHAISEGTNLVLAEQTPLTESMREEILAEYGVELLFLDPLTKGNYEKDAYLNGMTSNLEQIERALQDAQNH